MFYFLQHGSGLAKPKINQMLIIIIS